MGVPFVAFFGPTDPQRHLPPARHYKVLRRDLSCSPCYSSRCRILTHACMKDIMPEEVAGTIMELMDVRK
jgi:ADP-heptose:LPS heptosyltransferase